jgi:hypothetical protein
VREDPVDEADDAAKQASAVGQCVAHLLEWTRALPAVSPGNVRSVAAKKKGARGGNMVSPAL